MSPVGNLLEQIVKTRSKLEKKFSDFENSLMQKKAFLLTPLLEEPMPLSSESAEPGINQQEEPPAGSVFPAAISPDELRKLERKKEALELIVENLRRSLKAMAQDRKELLGRMERMQRQGTTESSSLTMPPAPAGELLSQISRLENECARLKSKREKSARVWKNWANKIRVLKRTIQDCQPPNSRKLFVRLTDGQP